MFAQSHVKPVDNMAFALCMGKQLHGSSGLNGLICGAIVALSSFLHGCGAESLESQDAMQPIEETQHSTAETLPVTASEISNQPNGNPDTDQISNNNEFAESTVSLALRTGDALVVEKADDLVTAAIEQIENDRTRFDNDIRRIFALNHDNTTNEHSITTVNWDPTHDAAMLIPSYGINTGVLFTNSVTATSKTVYEKSIAIAGDYSESGSTTRYMALGSNPMRNSQRNPELVGDQMHQFLRNSIDWLTELKPSDSDPLEVVIAHMDNSHYFPDESATRKWLDEKLTTNVSYNDQDSCDDEQLQQCLTTSTDLLIISQVLNENSSADNIATTVRNAMSTGIPVLYMHHDGGITELGSALLTELNIGYEWDNYWKRLQLSDFDITRYIGKTPENITAIKTLLEHLLARDYQFDWSQCTDEDCSTVPGLRSNFEEGALAVRSIMNALDKSNRDIFKEEGSTLTRLLALTGDRMRQNTVFPMDKNTTDDNVFLASYFADHAVYYSREKNPTQPDLGNFSRSEFDHIIPVNRSITFESKQPFRSAGVYALPGKTMLVSRTDLMDVEVEIFINTQRSGSSHQWATDGYNRPKFLKSPTVSIAAGETIYLTSPYGGPVQVAFSKNDLPVTLRFQNVGEHPHWSSAEDQLKFAQQLIDSHYDWAEMVTPGFEVHSTVSKMNESVNNSKWGDTEALASATMEYLHNYPHVLAGFQGPGIDTVAEIHDFAENKGFTVDSIDKVKHMNADQATCGYGCSGNPYDAYWSFDPLGHGDLHELGHGLEKSRLRFTGWPGHASTNHYSYYTKSQYYQKTGGDPECQSLPFQEMFNVLQAGSNATNQQAYIQQNLWDTNHWSHGAAMIVQMMMAAEDHNALLDGWHLLARLHIFEREFSRAVRSDEQWDAKQSSLGMSQYSRTQAKELAPNDWLLIALGVATDLDWRHYLNAWAIPISDQVATQVDAKGYPPVSGYFYISSGDGYCKGEGFDGQRVPLDGVSNWP